MNERTFRIVYGLFLLACLYFDLKEILIGFLVFLAFEGLTNLRIVRVAKMLGFGKGVDEGNSGVRSCRFQLEAERVLRLTVAVLVGISYFWFNDYLWFLPWFMSFMLLLAGITNICPMLMFLQRIGFKV
jgi:hypothetical protein